MKLEYALLSENDISSILNLICPNCGGPLGRPSREFMCQGHCRKDWGPDWESSVVDRKHKKTASRTGSRRSHSAA